MDGPVDGGSFDTLKPGTTLGRYEIRRLIGQGGMGCVYEAQHRDLKKRVAIKTLLPALASTRDARERFLREGEAASRIRHAHVVDVTDVGSEGAVIYLVMEYLEGEDLARLIARQGALPVTLAADIMLPVAAAIATAHDQGVIHRDLKPENIFLVSTEFAGVHPKVLDFGISKVLGDSRSRALTGSAATMGTMNYLPPEQLHAAREADARSDQYGLGTILYECVTGQRAFEDESFYVIIRKIAEGQFVRPSTRRPDLPPRMEETILRAMSLDPARRFDSVRHLGAALLDFGSDGARVLWTPFFSAARAQSGSNPRSPSASSPAASAADDRLRVATLLAPEPGPPPSRSPSSGATLELPSHHKSASTTMRSATGERARRTPSRSVPRPSRAPLVIGAIALVASAAALIVLRGMGTNSARVEPASAVSDEQAVAPLPRPRIIVPPPVVAAPERVSPPAADEESGSRARVDQAETGAGGARGTLRAVRKPTTKKSKSAARGVAPAPSPSATPSKPLNDAVIID